MEIHNTKKMTQKQNNKLIIAFVASPWVEVILQRVPYERCVFNFPNFEWKLSYELIKLGIKRVVNCKWLQIRNLFIAKQMVGKSKFGKCDKLNINIQSSMVG